MRYLYHFLSLILCCCLQGTLLKEISILGVVPNLFIVNIAIICFLAYKSEAIIVSTVFGFFLDVLIGRYTGVYTVLFLLAAYFVSRLSEKVFSNPRFYILALITLIVSLLVNSFYYLCVSLFMNHYNFKFVVYVVLVEALYNAVLSIPVYFIVKRLTRTFYSDKGE